MALEFRDCPCGNTLSVDLLEHEVLARHRDARERRRLLLRELKLQPGERRENEILWELDRMARERLGT